MLIHGWHLLLVVLMLSWANTVVAEEEEVKLESHYVELKPAFVTNYGQEDKGKSYLQAIVTLRVEGEESLSLVNTHMPLIRHNLVMLFSGLKSEEIGTNEQREVVRGKALAVIQEALQKEAPNILVQDLLFTRFVSQR